MKPAPRLQLDATPKPRRPPPPVGLISEKGEYRIGILTSWWQTV
jgi:hypothetical protein